MASDLVMLETRDGVATLTLNSPKNRNSLNEPLCKEMDRAIETVRKDDNARVLLITGVEGSFCSGGDMKEGLSDAHLARTGAFMQSKFANNLREDPYCTMNITHRIYEFPKPVIAAVNGFAVGAGVSFALACDIRIASDQAQFCLAFIKRGYIPDTGGTLFLIRLLGYAKACEVAYTGDFIAAEQAERMGLVNRIVPHAELMEEAGGFASRIAENPAFALKKMKEALRHALIETDVRMQMRYEQRINRVLTDTEDCMEGIRAFMEKREPIYTGK